MEFELYRCRELGRVRPRHMLWSTKVVGRLFVKEERESTLERWGRVAQFVDAQHKELVPALHDVTLISAKPDWWTFTGWELIDIGMDPRQTAYQQSWILVPVSTRSTAGELNG